MKQHAKMIEALRNLQQAHHEVRMAWEETDIDILVDNGAYPYDRSFDEIGVDVWADNVIGQLESLEEPSKLANDLEAFRMNIQVEVNEMLGDMSRGDWEYDGKFDLVMIFNTSMVRIPMSAETYHRLERFVNEELEEELK